MDEPEDSAADLFYAALERVLGPRIRENAHGDEQLCRDLWGALTNVEWIHESGKSVLYSFRLASAMVTCVVGEGEASDWYCAGPTGVVSEEIRAALRTEGWVPVIQASL